MRESRGVRISVSRDVRMCEQGCEKVRAGCENRREQDCENRLEQGCENKCVRISESRGVRTSV